MVKEGSASYNDCRQKQLVAMTTHLEIVPQALRHDGMDGERSLVNHLAVYWACTLLFLSNGTASTRQARPPFATSSTSSWFLSVSYPSTHCRRLVSSRISRGLAPGVCTAGSASRGDRNCIAEYRIVTVLMSAPVQMKDHDQLSSGMLDGR